jgi:type VI protein secretion system component VasK
MNRIALSLAIVSVCLMLGLGALYAHERDETAALRTQLQSLTEAQKRAQERAEYDRQVLVAREARKASEARKLARENQTLLNALRRNETWGNTNVPPDVQEALHGAAGALPAAPDWGSSDSPAGGVRN